MGARGGAAPGYQRGLSGDHRNAPCLSGLRRHDHGALGWRRGPAQRDRLDPHTPDLLAHRLLDRRSASGCQGNAGAGARPEHATARSGRAANGASSALARAIGNVTTRPLYWAGKLYFNTGEGSMVCSAQFIAPGILATASHCVQDDKSGRWYSQFLYRHQNNMGKGRDFSTECLATYKGWVSTERSHWTWDFAMVKLRGGDDLGHFGWQYHWWGTYDEVPKIGYPVAISNGQVMQVDFGKLTKAWDPRVIGLKHDNPSSAEGSSGGAWIGRYETNGSDTQSNFVISLTSHHLGQDRSISYGPYWDENFSELLKYAQRGCK